MRTEGKKNYGCLFFFWFSRNREGQVIDLIFMGRLTLERSHIQERSEGVLTAGVWGGECAGAVIALWLVGEKQGKMENKAQRGNSSCSVPGLRGCFPSVVGTGCAWTRAVAVEKY